jgi:hypothetical protein
MLQAAATRVKDGGRIVQFSTGGTKMPLSAAGLYAAICFSLGERNRASAGDGESGFARSY